MEEIPANIARKISFVPVETMDEVLREALVRPVTIAQSGGLVQNGKN
jgi:ATP-dependent Lon protease